MVHTVVFESMMHTEELLELLILASEVNID